MDGAPPPASAPTGAVPPRTARPRADRLRFVAAVGVAAWLAIASTWALFDGFRRWPDGSHDLAWSTTLAERERTALGDVQPVVAALERYTSPDAVILAAGRPGSTAPADVAGRSFAAMARFLVLPRMVVPVDAERWRERLEAAPTGSEVWLLDLADAVGPDAIVEQVAEGPGWRLGRPAAPDGDED